MNAHQNNQNGKTLSQLVDQLIREQKTNWEVARANYSGLEKVESKSFQFDGFKIKVQFNPERIRSSGAKLDAQTISQRPCFLCEANRSEIQRGIDFHGKYSILVNPYPIFQKHLTIPLNEHTPQRIEKFFTDMLHLSKELPDFTIFYNGPKCGASAPDHFHFQAADKTGMPICEELDQIIVRFGETLFQDEETSIKTVGRGYLRKLIMLASSSEKNLADQFQIVLDTLKERGQEGEPMMNILTNYQDGEWQTIVFPRDRQRPSQFFEDGDKQIIMSPAAVEFGGVAILPRKEDFDKLTHEDLQDIFNQVTINEAPSLSDYSRQAGNSSKEGEHEYLHKGWTWLTQELKSKLM